VIDINELYLGPLQLYKPADMALALIWMILLLLR